MGTIGPYCRSIGGDDDEVAAIDEDGASLGRTSPRAANDDRPDGAAGDDGGDSGNGHVDGDGDLETTGDWLVSGVLSNTMVSILLSGKSSSESST